MQTQDWKVIKTTLLEALNLEPSRRQSFLEEANLSAEVRAEVESLLTQESRAKDFMSVSASGFTREFFENNGVAENSLVGQKIGIYEIASELGLGGMGAVYLATRSDGKFEQKVAIKMLKRELNTQKIRRNFTREKEILAALSHPNIATLIDAGTTEDRIPYLVMEYIEGEPIDRFCQSRKLSLSARLKLFNKVCDTISFAHRALVVHRDLKPSNILVTKDGEPKLLDFGIARLLDAEADAGTITHLGAMTPLYASPEQIKGAPVTTATDVYSLGVVLFKILTGSLPHAPGKDTNGILHGEMAETQPTLPSEVARRSSLGDGGSTATGNFRNSPISSSELKGDLDNIVLKALRKEPDRRYQSVEQFSADIWRFVDDIPVLARPSTLRYRASKFYGRNKVSVLAAALILISLFAGIGIAVSQAKAARAQARIASEAQRQAELETERAQTEEEKALRTSRFMQSFFEYANPNWYGRGKGRLDVTVREAIDDAAGRIDTELTDQLEVRADLHYTIGQVYASHNEPEIYLRHMRQSFDLYRRALGEQHPKVARAIYYLSMAMKGTGTSTEEASAFLREGIAMMRQTGPDNVNLPYMLQQLAHWIMYEEEKSRNASRLREAESLILEAKTLFIHHYGENHGSTRTTDGSLALLSSTRGDLERAESIRAEILRRHRQLEEGGYSHIWSLTYLAKAKLARGKVTEAEALFKEAMDLAHKQWNVNDPRLRILAGEINKARAAQANQ